MKQNILITRPNIQAQDIKTFLEENNYNVFIEPIFTVKNFSLSDEELLTFKQKKYDGIIVTSFNGAQSAIETISNLNLGKNIKIFAVGKKTAEIFIKSGYKNVFFPDEENAKNLEKLIIEKSTKIENFLYFCGELITLDFKQNLNKYDFFVEKIISYKILPNEFFSENFLKEVIKINFDFVLLYSKNSAQIFFDLLNKHNLQDYFQNTKFLCLSQEIEAFVHQLGFKNSATFAKSLILNKFYD